MRVSTAGRLSGSTTEAMGSYAGVTAKKDLIVKDHLKKGEQVQFYCPWKIEGQ